MWSALYTQHTLALALGFAGLTWSLRYSGLDAPPDNRRRAGLLYVGALLFALAFYANQSAIDAAAATTLWLIACDFRKGLRLAGLLAGLIVIPFAVVNIVAQGGLWEKVIANHAVSWSNSRAWRLIGRVWSEYWPLMLWALACLVGIVVGLVNRVLGRGSKSALREAIASPWTLAALYTVIAASIRDGPHWERRNKLQPLFGCANSMLLACRAFTRLGIEVVGKSIYRARGLANMERPWAVWRSSPY